MVIIMYKIKEISKIASISTRTLRYYDQIGLLKPSFINKSNYRIYTDKEIDLLQQIMFFKQMGFELQTIKKIIHSNDFDFTETLLAHKEKLLRQKRQIDLLIQNISKTILTKKGAITMTNKEKFEGFKQELIHDNEKKYGEEIRQKYGNSSVNSTYQNIQKMSKRQMAHAKELEKDILVSLQIALKDKNPLSPLAIEICQLHEEWIKLYWTNYTKEAHKSLAKMYTEDERFTAYYDKVGEGAAVYLYNALKIYLN